MNQTRPTYSMKQREPSPAASTPKERPLGRFEILTLILMFAVVLAFRLIYIYHDPFDSDEPQHLHVAWGWTRGLVQYRDYFDNHAPLFHLLTAPLLSFFGERADILILMRLMMLPLFAVVMLAAYGIGRSLISRRAGLWAAIFIGLFPSLFLCSLEYRTDNLWVMLWLVALYIFLSGPLSWKRCLAGGLSLGLAFSVSCKTIIMLGALGSAMLLMPLLSSEFRQAFTSWRKTLVYGGLILGAMLAPVLILVAFFYHLGALHQMFYLTISHNILPKAPPDPHLTRKMIFHNARNAWIWSIFYITFFSVLGWCCCRKILNRNKSVKATLLILITVIFAAILQIFWPVGQVQTFMPFHPIFILSLVTLAHVFWPRPQTIRLPGGLTLERLTPLICLGLAALEIYVMTSYVSPWRNGTLGNRDFLGAVLKLTNPGDTLLDAKGESIYRPRPFYYGLEKFTQERFGRDQLPALTVMASTFLAPGQPLPPSQVLQPENIIQCCIAMRTCVALSIRDRFSGTIRSKLDDMYMDIGHDLSVAGHVLDVKGPIKGRALTFNVLIPARYAMVNQLNKPAAGKLDGASYRGPRSLSAGPHVFVSDREEKQMAFIWAQSIERGFAPFSKPKSEGAPVKDDMPAHRHRHHHHHEGKPRKGKFSFKRFLLSINTPLFKVTH